MRKLDYNEYKICQIMARIFEKSIELSNQSSPIFIKRFMNYDGTECFNNKTYLAMTNNEEDIILELNEKYLPSKNKVLFNKNEMYWIGYTYGALAFLYNLSFKSVYKLFSGNEIVKYYPIYHTFDVEEASERMMENIGYVSLDYMTKAKIIFRKLILEDSGIKYNANRRVNKE